MSGTTSTGLWVTHNKDPITIPCLPPRVFFEASYDRVKGADLTTPLEAHGHESDRRWRYIVAQESMDTSDELHQAGRGPTTSFSRRPLRGSLEDVPGLSAKKVKMVSHRNGGRGGGGEAVAMLQELSTKGGGRLIGHQDKIPQQGAGQGIYLRTSYQDKD